MRDRFVFLGLSAIVLVLAVWFGPAQEAAKPNGGYTPMERVTIWIAADPHYLSPELTDHGACFQKTVEQSDGKVTEYSEELLEAFVEQAIVQAPDAVILPGDLTFNGAQRSHAGLAAKLHRIADAGIPVLILPGNHDLENPMAAAFRGDGFYPVDSITEDAFAELYGIFPERGALAWDLDSLSCTAELTSGLRVLLVDVNTADAPGRLTDTTLSWVEGQLQDAARNGARILAVSHQNLLQHNQLFSGGYVMENGTGLLTLYEKYGVLCNLSGHMHVQHIARSEHGFLEIAGSSLAVSPNQFGILILEGNSAEYRTETVDVSGWAAKRNLSDPALLDFKRYAYGFFAGTAVRQAEAELEGVDNASEMAAFFAQSNTAYFAGRTDALNWDSAIYQQWQKQPSFFAAYLAGIADDGPQNHTVLSFDF